MKDFYAIRMDDIDGEPLCLSQYRNKVMMLVNVASRCGLTPQYAGLQSLYERYKDRGLVIIGLPCNQFGAQEPWPEAQIKGFCSTEYKVTFPMTQKIDVNGEKRHVIYDFLAGEDSPFPGDIKWNFEKFLLNKEGVVSKRFEATLEPTAREVVKSIEALL